MIFLYEKSLPKTINVGGRLIFLETDYRAWIRFLAEIDNTKGSKIDISYLFKDLDQLKPEDKQMIKEGYIPKEIFKALNDFAGKESIYPLPNGKKGSQVPTTDYAQDGPFIYASFMKAYHIDLCNAEMHWYQFKALLQGLTLDYSTIISCRLYDGKDAKLKEERECWSITRAKIQNKEESAQTEVNRVYEYLLKLNKQSHGQK